MSIEDEIAKKHGQKLVEAKFAAEQSQARVDDLMARSYQDPQRAAERMNDFRAKNSDEKLYEVLEGNARKTAFGRRPGSIASTDGFTAGASARRQDSIFARRGLAPAIKEHLDDQANLKTAIQAHNQAPGKVEPERAAERKPTGSFSKAMAERREAIAKDPKAQEEQRAKTLADMERERQLGKGLGR